MTDRFWRENADDNFQLKALGDWCALSVYWCVFWSNVSGRRLREGCCLVETLFCEFLYRLDELVDVVLSREIDYFTL